jgi:hypothetical protein
MADLTPLAVLQNQTRRHVAARHFISLKRNFLTEKWLSPVAA